MLVSTTIHAQELIQIPPMPTAVDLSKAISAPKADCESCKEIAKPAPLHTNPIISAKIINDVDTLKSANQCSAGRKRLANDVSFYVNGGSISKTTIGGNWQPGFLTTGTVSDLYVGVSGYKDLMFVTKVTNGGKVVGYNVTLSFCELPNAYPNYPALISDDRPLTSFQAPYGLIIDTSTACGYGTIAAAFNTVVISQKKANDAHTTDFPVYTSFSKPTCK